MASGRQALFLLLFFFCCAAVARIPSVHASSKVRLELFYETLCPYCTRFIVNHLYKIFDNGLIDIVDLNLVPYGNARVGPGGSITCQVFFSIVLERWVLIVNFKGFVLIGLFVRLILQHGSYECLLNTVEACAIHTWPDVVRKKGIFI